VVLQTGGETADRPVGICGQAPSDHPDFAEFLVEAGIDSISVIPDSVADVIQHVAQAEAGGQSHEERKVTPHAP
jgi:phosphoenolpyruvate synthase/pyruvate phosphate dikinase